MKSICKGLSSALAALFLCSGCSNLPGLYAELGGGMKLRSSRILKEDCHTVRFDGGERSCGGDNPTAHFNVGWEFREDRKLDRCEIWAHMSHAFDGGVDREFWLEDGGCYWRWGGR